MSAESYEWISLVYEQMEALMAAGDAMRGKGFTLIELLVAIAVLVILATVAIPSFRGLLSSNRIASDYNEIVSGFHAARSHSVKLRKEVTVLIDSDSGAWRLRVQADNSTVYERKGRDSTVSVNGGGDIEVVFSSLGRLSKCTISEVSSFSNCIISLDGKSMKIDFSGRVDNLNA